MRRASSRALNLILKAIFNMQIYGTYLEAGSIGDIAFLSQTEFHADFFLNIMCLALHEDIFLFSDQESCFICFNDGYVEFLQWKCTNSFSEKMFLWAFTILNVRTCMMTTLLCDYSTALDIILIRQPVFIILSNKFLKQDHQLTFSRQNSICKL